MRLQKQQRNLGKQSLLCRPKNTGDSKSENIQQAQPSVQGLEGQ